MAEINADLLQKAKIFSEKLLSEKNIVVIHHHDADGITSGAILVKALQRAGKKPKYLGIKQLYSETIDEIKGLGAFFVFVDFGSSHLAELSKAFGSKFLVIDHHIPKDKDKENILNCWHFGIDGSKHASGSALAFLVAKNLGENNDLSALAVTGAIGDIQEQKNGLAGINQKILEEGCKAGVIEAKKDLRLYGRFTRPLAQLLAFSTDPIIPMLTGNEKNCTLFLLDRNFSLKENNTWISYAALPENEKKRLCTELILYMHSLKVPEWKIERLVGEVYLFPGEKFGPLKEAKEYSTLLNACGRNNALETAMQVCLGDRELAFSEALSLLAEHRKRLREGIELVSEEGLKEKKSFYYFNAGSRIKDSLVGVIAGMLYSSNAIPCEKPIVAFAEQTDGLVKVSARATPDLVKKGINLASAMRECCDLLGKECEGGGHKIAAGARLPPDFTEKFLEVLDKTLEEQLQKN